MSNKNIQRYKRIKLQRMFIGTYAPTSRNERWSETGNFFRGVSLILDKIYEVDGLEHVAEGFCGYLAGGSAQPSQNMVEDLSFNRQFLSGKRPVAMLCGDSQLWLFRPKLVNSKKFIDRRLSMKVRMGYDGQRPTSFVEFSGWIPDFEVLEISDFKFEGGKLSYKTIRSLAAESIGSTEITNS